MAGRVFINYRGVDSHGYAALLRAELSQFLGPELVFLDTESIPAGSDYVDELLTQVRQARVLLAVIGPRWADGPATGGGRWIDASADWIRRELAEAFAAGVTVIPVLTDGAELPGEQDLPSDIAELARLQYRRLRRADTTADLHRLRRDLTRLDPDLAAAARRRSHLPRQLPAVPDLFTARVPEMAVLSTALGAGQPGTGEEPARGVAVISAIGGVGGIGKTWLALQWARTNINLFPDGQLFVDLRGFDPSGEPMPPEAALRGFLEALGVEQAAVPAELPGQAALYRTLLANRRLVIVLDNAADSAQVVPLLPGGSSCAVLVTSRRQLTGLATTHGARILDLDVLDRDDANDLLARRVGADRIAREPAAVAELLHWCAGLPLALAIVAARAASQPTFPLRTLAEELRDHAGRLDALDTGEQRSSVRAVLSWSYHWLTAEQAVLFGLLGIAPTPEFSLLAVADLAALPVAATRRVLRELAAVHLVQQHAPGRYRMHDLVRLYAREQAEHDQPVARRDAAVRRLLDHYLLTALTADRLLAPQRQPLPQGTPPGSGHPPPLDDAAAALTWLSTEHDNLLIMQRSAAEHRWHSAVWHLAWALDTFHWRHGHRPETLATWNAALAAAEYLDDPQVQIRAHRRLGEAHNLTGHHAEALHHLHQALALAEHADDLTGQANIHLSLVGVWEQQHAHDRALVHAIRALDLYRSLDSPIRHADALNSVGWCYAQIADYDQARTHCQAALDVFRRLGDRDGEAATQDSLGYIAHHAGRHTDALDHYQHALTLHRALDDAYYQADTLNNLGHTQSARGDHAAARHAWEEAALLYRTQHRDSEARQVEQQLRGLDHHPARHAGREPTPGTDRHTP